MVTRTDNLFVGDSPFLYKETGKWPSHEERRSTRVSLKIDIAAQGVSEPLRCDGETIVVNRNGALIWTNLPLRVEMEIEIHVIMTDKRAYAKVVYVDPERPRVCGIGLVRPENVGDCRFPQMTGTKAPADASWDSAANAITSN